MQADRGDVGFSKTLNLAQLLGRTVGQIIFRLLCFSGWGARLYFSRSLVGVWVNGGGEVY